MVRARGSFDSSSSPSSPDVSVASDREVLEAISLTRYDLILMDCQMPEVDGFTATQRIREMERGNGSHLAIALTALKQTGDKDLARRREFARSHRT